MCSPSSTRTGPCSSCWDRCCGVSIALLAQCNAVDVEGLGHRSYGAHIMATDCGFGLGMVLVLASACTSPPPASRDVKAPPNIVFVLADDMGYGDPGCNNPDSKISTPHIDSLAENGLRFTDAHAPAAVCVPSRYGLLTGRYPSRPRTFHPNREAVIEDGRVTVASLLREHGYATGMVGKWHLGFDGGPDHDYSQSLHGGPLDRGFDSFFGIPASLDIPPYYYIRDRTPVAPPSELIEASATEGWTDIQGAFWRSGGVAPGFDHAEVLPRLEREAVGFIDEHAGAERPFFLYVALPAPHTPWLPLARYRGESAVDMYGEFVMQVDDTVGHILEALDRNGVADDTLVIFSSDNGPVWYPSDVERLGHASVGPLRGMKGDAWEGGHLMPFLVRLPGRVEPGGVCGRTICCTDLMATLADVLDVPVPDGAGEDSSSFLSLLHDPEGPATRQVTILKANASVVREGRWKLITHLGSGGFSRPRRQEPREGGPTGQLYDLENDLAETTNLWTERPDVVARLQAYLR